MSQAIVPQNGNRALAPMSGGLEGVEGFTSADLKIPVIKLVHGVSRMEKAEKHVGEWWNSITGEFAESLDVIILHVKHARSLFDGASEQPECVSRDGITGSTHGACSGCDYNADVHQELWETSELKRCNKGYSLLCYLPEDASLALFTAMKTNVSPIKTLMTQLYFRKLPVFGALVTFNVQTQTGDNKKWYTVAPKIKQPFDAQTTQGYREMAVGLSNASYEVVEDELDAASIADIAEGTYTTAEAADAIEAATNGTKRMPF